MPNSFMPTIKTDADVTLASGVKVRLFRAEPFKFMNEITKWLESINAGEIQAFNMNTDVNGWCNFAIAYREYKEPSIAEEKRPDPIMVLYDTVALLKDLAEEVSKLSKDRAGVPSSSPANDALEVPAIGI